MDGPTCGSSSTKTIQARGESSSVQELDQRTYPSLLNKLQAPRLSDLGRMQYIHAVVVMAEHHAPIEIDLHNSSWDSAQLTCYESIIRK